MRNILFFRDEDEEGGKLFGWNSQEEYPEFSPVYVFKISRLDVRLNFILPLR